MTNQDFSSAHFKSLKYYHTTSLIIPTKQNVSNWKTDDQDGESLNRTSLTFNYWKQAEKFAGDSLKCVMAWSSCRGWAGWCVFPEEEDDTWCPDSRKSFWARE